MQASRLSFVILLSLLAVLANSSPGRAQSDEAAALDKRVVTLHKAGKSAEAMPLATQSLALRTKALPADHPHIAISLNNLAALHRAQGRPAEAEPLYKRALEMRERTLPPCHPDIAASLDSLAALYQAQGRPAEAAPLIKRAADLRTKHDAAKNSIANVR